MVSSHCIPDFSNTRIDLSLPGCTGAIIFGSLYVFNPQSIRLNHFSGFPVASFQWLLSLFLGCLKQVFYPSRVHLFAVVSKSVAEFERDWRIIESIGLFVVGQVNVNGLIMIVIPGVTFCVGVGIA